VKTTHTLDVPGATLTYDVRGPLPASDGHVPLLLIGSWNNLLWAFIVLRSEDMYTLPLLIYLLQGETRTSWGMLMAAGLLATLPLVIAFLFFQRSFIAGITAGAIKS